MHILVRVIVKMDKSHCIFHRAPASIESLLVYMLIAYVSGRNRMFKMKSQCLYIFVNERFGHRVCARARASVHACLCFATHITTFEPIKYTEVK